MSTTGSTARASLDSDGMAQCARPAQMAMLFDTQDLHDGHSISSAAITVTIKSQVEVGEIQNRKLTFLVGSTSSACGSYTLGSNEFYSCTPDMVDIGTVIVSAGETGAVSLTVPSPNQRISKTGRTRVLLFDSSMFPPGTSGASHEFELYTVEATDPAKRPKLQVTYD